jgi:hypothetical protein
MQKKNGLDIVSAEPPKSEPEPMEMTVTEPTMEVDDNDSPEEEAPVEEIPMAETPKKKKKKASYKNMMAGVLKSASPCRDIEMEKEGLRKVTGGGVFAKVEKI